MAHFQNKLDQLKNEIDHVTRSIMEQIESGTLAEIEGNLTKRATLLADLIALAANEISKGEVLREYMLELQNRDQVMIQSILKEKQELQDSIINFNKINKYFNV